MGFALWSLGLCGRTQVLVTATGNVDDQDRASGSFSSLASGEGECVRRFQCRQDSLAAVAFMKGVQGLSIADRRYAQPPGFMKANELGPDAGVVQSRGNGVRAGNLALIILQNK